MSLTVTQLLGSANEQYVVPAYQRRYSWHEKQLWELIDDVSLIENSDTHLLGSIVCLAGHHTAGMNRLELVDGQQRLTTLSILLQCVFDRLKRENEVTAAQDVERLLQAKALGTPPVRKIALDSLDAEEYERLASGDLIEHPANPSLANAFATFRSWANEKPLTDLATFLYRLQNQAIIIRLDVSDAKDAFKLFETINNRGLKLSPTDIIKNFILGNAARFGPNSLTVARRKWAEVIQHLDGLNYETFFRHFLCARLKKRITISYVISNFKSTFMQEVAEAAQLPERHWYEDEEDDLEEDGDVPGADVEEQPQKGAEAKKRIPFNEFLDQLVANARTYGQIVRGTTGRPSIDRRLRNLRMIKSVQTYGFLTHLKVGGCEDETFEEVLDLTESFLLRRHVCRERSNENETAFARLCGVDPKDPIDVIVKTYREYCPADDKFRNEFSKAEFGPYLIERARYCLERLEMHAQGKHLELLVGGTDLVHVEHIIPQKIKTKKAKDEFGDWTKYLGPNAESLHPRYVSRIGNLSLFSGTLNIGASNNPYERKKQAYRDSAIKITRALPDLYAEFRFDQVEERSTELAKLAVTLWPTC